MGTRDTDKPSIAKPAAASSIRTLYPATMSGFFNSHFAREVRRTMSNKTDDNDADERTPLVNGGPSGSPSHHIIPNGNHGTAKAFFFDSRHTPGLESDNLAIRSLVYTWHIAKVTILSNYTNILLPMVPIGIIAGAMGGPDRRLRHQLLCDHPPRRCSLFCDRGDLDQAG